MGQRLSPDLPALALLANALATGAALAVLIIILGPISGAHFNPVVSLIFALRRELPLTLAAAYVVVQIVGACMGAVLAHAMFDLPLIQVADQPRQGSAQLLSEAVATFGLLLAILGAFRFRPTAISLVVGLYITAAYWFTASTSFANPAVTVARTLTDTFSGISPASAPAFVGAQIVGAIGAVSLAHWLFREDLPDA